tara:strand:- start:1367 stop:1654 length:288 start_codon:yes stop_codon:yes gene_type:complete
MRIKFKTTIKKTENICLENSWGNTEREKKEVTYNIEVDAVKQYGFFEMYCDNGQVYYAEGGLWFTGGVLTDYDGIFDLPNTIKEKLTDWGFDTSQ